MKVQKILWIVPIVPETFFMISLFYYKIRSYLSITFNSFYLLTMNILILLLFHSSIEFNIFGTIKINKLIFPIVFFFSYIIRIKRILDLLSLSDILKLKRIKGNVKSKLLYDKVYYCFELSYLIKLLVLSAIFIYLSYIYIITTNMKYIIESISFITIIFFIFKISKSDIKKKFKKSFSIELIIFYIIFSNLLFIESGLPQKFVIYQKYCFYLIEILYIIFLSINCKIFSQNHIFKKNCLINKKLNSDFSSFLNNELSFHSFMTFIGKNKNDSEILILLKLYLDINTYTINTSLNEKNKDADNIINYINSNKQFIKNHNLKEIFGKINDKKNEAEIFGEIYKYIYGILNKKFEEYKNYSEYKRLTAFLDLIFYLDEYIFAKAFYFDYFQNEQLVEV